jgi:hypothetical protein
VMSSVCHELEGVSSIYKVSSLFRSTERVFSEDDLAFLRASGFNTLCHDATCPDDLSPLRSSVSVCAPPSRSASEASAERKVRMSVGDMSNPV